MKINIKSKKRSINLIEIQQFNKPINKFNRNTAIQLNQKII